MFGSCFRTLAVILVDFVSIFFFFFFFFFFYSIQTSTQIILAMYTGLKTCRKKTFHFINDLGTFTEPCILIPGSVLKVCREVDYIFFSSLNNWFWILPVLTQCQDIALTTHWYVLLSKLILSKGIAHSGNSTIRFFEIQSL